MTDEPTEAALPPGHVPTVRIATPDPRSAKRHIRTRSGWAHYYMAACVVDFPKKYSETGSAPVEDIECPRCRQTPEFARAIAAAREPEQFPRTPTGTVEVSPEPPTTARPKTPAPQRKKPARNDTADQSRPSPQGSLF